MKKNKLSTELLKDLELMTVFIKIALTKVEKFKIGSMRLKNI